MRTRALSTSDLERRRAVVGPLFSYMADHGIKAGFIARRAGLRLGIVVKKQRLWQMKAGRCVVPAGFIEAMCREMERSVEEVMGREWIDRYGADLLAGRAGEALEERGGEDAIRPDAA